MSYTTTRSSYRLPVTSSASLIPLPGSHDLPARGSSQFSSMINSRTGFTERSNSGDGVNLFENTRAREFPRGGCPAALQENPGPLRPPAPDSPIWRTRGADQSERGGSAEPVTIVTQNSLREVAGPNQRIGEGRNPPLPQPKVWVSAPRFAQRTHPSISNLV